MWTTGLAGAGVGAVGTGGFALATGLPCDGSDAGAGDEFAGDDGVDAAGADEAVRTGVCWRRRVYADPRASKTATMAVPCTTRRRRRFATSQGGGVGDVGPSIVGVGVARIAIVSPFSVSSAPRAWQTASPVWYRSPGSFSSRVRMTRSMPFERRIVLARLARPVLDVLPRDLVPVLARERQDAGRGPIQRHAERVQTGAAVERQATCLLGREVLRR